MREASGVRVSVLSAFQSYRQKQGFSLIGGGDRSGSRKTIIRNNKHQQVEKMKSFENQIVNVGKKGKGKLEKIRSSEWAEPTGKALKAAASVVSLIPPPVGSVLKGALSVGAAVLNQDPTPEEINKARQATFLKVAEDMEGIKSELSDLRGDIGDLLKLISDKEFYKGIKTIDAHYQFYVKGLGRSQ